tara:strand:- start:767 stop:1039 length:273 start_codon:yes stop_codon:yes gene_type:complete
MSKWGSRKLAAFVLVAVVYAVNAIMGSPIEAEALGSIATVAIAYVLGQSAVDSASQFGGAKIGTLIGEALAGMGEAEEAEEEPAEEEPTE